MACQLFAICFHASQPLPLARFWSGLLGRDLVEDPFDGVTLPSGDDLGYRIRFLANREPKIGQNRAHFDLTSASLADQRQKVARALELGGRHIDIGQDPEDDHVVLADPEGNEFCVVGPENNFLAGCGSVGALSCDGPQEVGYFWSKALEWPLVWDQDEETAIQCPHGGMKISWGGPPFMPRLGRDRLTLDLVPSAPDDRRAEVDRLLALGATLVDPGRDDDRPMLLSDPDGNEFRVLAPR